MTDRRDRIDERMDAVLTAMRAPAVVSHEVSERVAAAAVLAQSPAARHPARLARIAATLAIVALGGALVTGGREDALVTRTGATSRSSEASPAPLTARYAAHAASDARPIVFELEAPAARSVQVLGDFNDWARGANSMQRGADGRWRLTALLPPGRYVYAFLVDGRRFTRDPSRDAVEDRDFGVTGSEVVVGEAP